MSTRAEKSDLSIHVDYPLEEELVMPGHYAIRIGSDSEAEVEVSINDSEWQTCRWSVGYHWYDWWPTQAGDINIVLRFRTGKGRWKKTDRRRCRVIGSASN